MRHLVLTTVAMAILAIGVWGQSAQTPTTTAPGPAATEKKAPEGKSGKHHHHHKHHHKKAATQ